MGVGIAVWGRVGSRGPKLKHIAYLCTKREKVVETQRRPLGQPAGCDAFRLFGQRFHAHVPATASTINGRAAESLDMSYGAGPHGLPSNFLTEVSWDIGWHPLLLVDAAD